MNNKTILVLGGYGSTGRPLCTLLLRETTVKVVIAGRNLAKAAALAAELNSQFGEGRATAVSVDAASQSSLEAAFAKVDSGRGGLVYRAVHADSGTGVFRGWG